MSDDILKNARKNSIKKERRRIIRRRRKIANYSILLVLITSILANVIFIKRIDFSKNPTDFSEITYGIDYDKEFDDVTNLIESCFIRCLRVKINSDTHPCKDENGFNTGKYYYNFTDYDDVFYNFEVMMNLYRLEYNDIEKINEDLTEEEIQAILVRYGLGIVDVSARDSFKNHVGRKLENMSGETIIALAEGAVRRIATNYLDSKWSVDLERGATK